MTANNIGITLSQILPLVTSHCDVSFVGGAIEHSQTHPSRSETDIHLSRPKIEPNHRVKHVFLTSPTRMKTE